MNVYKKTRIFIFTIQRYFVMKIFFSSQFSSLDSFLTISDRENRYFLTKIQKSASSPIRELSAFFQNAFAALILYIFVKNSFIDISDRFRIDFSIFRFSGMFRQPYGIM